MQRRSFLKTATATTCVGGLLQGWAASAQGQAESALDSKADSASTGEGNLIYRPVGGRVGDVIPFFADGLFRIFHLYRGDGSHSGTTWHQVTTRDFVHFTDMGEMLPLGTPSDQDFSVATGSVIESNGRYHAFYTGYNSQNLAIRPEQGVMHAVSDDLVKWTKIPSDTFYAPADRFERNDWRDPFVFWNEEAREYWMLVAARLKSGTSRRRGCTALCASKDLSHWEVRQPFWAPGLYFTHECADLFRMGDWWYLIFSEFSESNQTRYRMSHDIRGPWITPEVDTFDTRALYAAKTASDGRRRYLFGWNPRREGAIDGGKWEWGGSLVTHELVQQPNGALTVRLPDTVRQAFSSPIALSPEAVIGKAEIAGDRIRIAAAETFSAVALATMPQQCRASARIEFTEGTHACGLLLRLGDDLDSGYSILLEPQHQRVVFDRWPRPGDEPFVQGMERPVRLRAGEPVALDVLVDGTAVTVYVNDAVALSMRMYDHTQGSLAIFAQQGSATFRGNGLYRTGAAS